MASHPHERAHTRTRTRTRARVLEAALFVADQLGVESIVLQVKGSPPPRRRAENAAEDAFGLPYDLSLPCRGLELWAASSPPSVLLAFLPLQLTEMTESPERG